MAERVLLFLAGLSDDDAFYEEIDTSSDTITVAGITMNGNIVMQDNSITGLAAPSSDGDAATKAYVDEQVISGGHLKEAVLHEDQLDDTEGLLAAAAITMQANPVSGDTIVITDGTTTRTYGAGTGGDVQYTIGATPTDTMQNLATAIVGDGSAAWGAVFSSDLDAIDINGVVVLVEDDNDGAVSRVYGVWATQANVEHVDFLDELDYTKKTLTTLDASDPGASASNFGIRRTQSALTDGELHYVLEADTMYSWDDSGDTWQLKSGSGAIPDATSASGGGVKGKVTFDSDKGAFVSFGVMEVKLDDVTLDFDGSGDIAVTGLPTQFEINGLAVSANVTHTNLNTLTDGSSGTTLHNHSHANATGQSADDHHNQQHTIVGSDHTASGLTAGQVIRATGATTFAWSSLGHGDLSGIGVDDHHNQQHALDGGDHSVSGLTTGHVLQALSATTFGFAAPPAVSAASNVEGVYNTATDATSNGDPVYWNGTDTLGKARADTITKSRIIGVIESGGGAAPATVTVVSNGPCTGVLSSATPGRPYFLGTTGGLALRSAATSGDRLIRMGYAKNASDLWVEIQDMGRRA